MRASIPFVLFVTVLAAATAHAQTVFKSTMPDGNVVYAEKPQPGATRVDKIEPPPAKTGMGGLTKEEKARAEQLTRDRAKAASADTASRQKTDDARKQVEQAKAALEKGREPLPGERIGLAGGGTRLSDAYHTRQKSLEQAVQAAEKQLAASQGR